MIAKNAIRCYNKKHSDIYKKGEFLWQQTDQEDEKKM